METAVPETPFEPTFIARYVEERSRLRVAFRLILAIPHLIFLYLGLIVTFVLAVVGWFAALILGRLPGPIAKFLSQFVVYFTRVSAYVYLLTDWYPPFNLEARDWAVDVELAPGRLNRLAVLFRIILMIPAYLVGSIVFGGLLVCSPFIWLLLLITGRMPRSLFDAMVAVQRYWMRLAAYWFMVSAAYPSNLFGDPAPGEGAPLPPDRPLPSDVPALPEAAPAPPPIPATEVGAPVVTAPPESSLVLSSTSKKILVLFIVLGVAYNIGVGFAYPNWGEGGLISRLRVRNSFLAANQSFGARVGTFQQTVEQCDSQPEPFRCAQDAERGLVSALVRFDSAVGRIDFPDELSSQVAAVRGASTAFRNAIEALIGADSEEEYFQLVPSLTERGNDFDSAVVALGTELDRLVEGA